jgi:hypothetical protein
MIDRTQINNLKLEVTKFTFSSRATTNTDSSSFKYNPFDLNRPITNLTPPNHKRFNGGHSYDSLFFPKINAVIISSFYRHCFSTLFWNMPLGGFR